MSGASDDAQHEQARDPIARARAVGYSDDEIGSVPQESVLGMGCGNPVAVATLREGEAVLDIGCGGGLDVFLAAARVGPSGLVIGVDSSDEVLAIARASSEREGYTNVEFRLGSAEGLPVQDASVDAVISNCVISDIADKRAVFREARRVLRPGGRVLIADLVFTSAPPDDLSGVSETWAAWIPRAVSREAYLDAMTRAGLRDVAISEARDYASPGMPPQLAGRIASILVRARK